MKDCTRKNCLQKLGRNNQRWTQWVRIVVATMHFSRTLCWKGCEGWGTVGSNSTMVSRGGEVRMQCALCDG